MVGIRGGRINMENEYNVICPNLESASAIKAWVHSVGGRITDTYSRFDFDIMIEDVFVDDFEQKCEELGLENKFLR